MGFEQACKIMARYTFVSLVFLVNGLQLGAQSPEEPLEPPLKDSDRQHWSYLKPARPTVPKVNNSSWVKTPVDSFILTKLEEKQIEAIAGKLIPETPDTDGRERQVPSPAEFLDTLQAVWKLKVDPASEMFDEIAKVTIWKHRL